MPWAQLLALIQPHALVPNSGRPPFKPAMLLRVHCLQQWFELSDLGAEVALFETHFLRNFVASAARSLSPIGSASCAFDTCSKCTT